MVAHPGPRWQRSLHLIVIVSMLLTGISPLASPPRTLAAAPERRYVLPAFDLRAELAGLPLEARQEPAAAGSSSGEGQKQPAAAQSSAPALGLPPEPEPAQHDAVPAILQATVDPPMAKAGELVTVTVVVTAEGDVAAGTLASDLPQGVTFASALGERTIFLTAGRRLQRSLSAVADGGTATWHFQLRVGADAPDLTVLPIHLDVPGLDGAYGEAEIGRLFPPAEARITPEKGGSLRSADGRVELVFPSGAVDLPLSVRHTPRAVHRLGAQGSGQAIEFDLEALTDAGAAVQTFKKPYQLRVDLRGLVDLGSLQFCQYPYLRYREGNGPWKGLDSDEDEDHPGVLVADLDHFSSIGGGVDNLMSAGWVLTFNDAEVSTFSGAFVYNYPFKLPAGRGGLTPDLTLNYNSRRVDGLLSWTQSDWAGMGWTLDNMEIDRYIRPHYDGDGNNDWFDADDAKFYYNPSADLKTFRLLYSGTAYPLVPEVVTQAFGLYHTHDEQFLSIERHNPQEGDNSSPNDTGEYWIVRLKDGTEYRLGYNEDAEQVTHSLCYSKTVEQMASLDWQAYAGDLSQTVAFRWRVDRIQDTRGNRIEYSYKTEHKVGGPARETATYMQEIRYNFQDGVPLARVAFLFDDRGDKDGGRISDTDQRDRDYALPFYQRSHLDRIQVWVRSRPASPETLLREYKLDFDAIDRSDTCTFRVLNYIREKGTEGVGGFNATTIGYTMKENKVWNSTQDPLPPEWERETFKHPRVDSINNGYGGVITVNYNGVGGDYTHPINHYVYWKKTADDNGGSKVTYAVPTGRSGWCYDDNGDGICDPAAGDDHDLVGYRTVTETLQKKDDTNVGRVVHYFAWSPSSAPSALLGREKKTQRTKMNGDLIQQIDTTWLVYTHTFTETAQPFTSALQCFFVYPAVISESTAVGTDPVLPGTPQKVTTYAYDLTYGNQVAVTETVGGALYRSIETEYHPNAGAWIVDRQARTSVYNAGHDLLSESHTIYDDPANSYDTPPVRGEPVATAQRASLDPEEWITQTVTYITRTVAYSEAQMLDGVLVTPTAEYTQTLPVISADALGRQTVTDYDDTWTRVLTVTPPVTQEYTGYEYDDWGRVLTETTANGKVYYGYDTLGRLISGTLPGDSVQYPTLTFDYCDSCVELRIMTRERLRPGDATTIPTIRFYNGLGQLIQESQGTDDGSQMRTSYTYYSRWGSVQDTYVPYSRTYSTSYVTPDTTRDKTTSSYDAVGRPTLTTYPDGTTVHTYYNGLQKAVLDENGHQVQYETDPLGRLIAVREYTGTFTTVDWDNPPPPYATTQYGYDLFDRLVAVTDTLGNLTTITYDTLGRKVAMDDPDMGDWGYAYDKVGNLITQTDALDRETIFTYDDANRLIANAYGAGQPPAVEYLYGSDDGVVGYRLAMTDTSGSTAWTYDERGRVITETKIVGDDTFVTGYTYDQRDRVLTQTYPGDNQGHPGEVVTTDYDKWGQPYSLIGDATYVKSVDLDSAGRLDMVKLGGTPASPVIKLDYIYHAWDAANGRGRLKQIKAGPPSDLDQLQNLNYTYDAVGNVLSINDVLDTNQPSTFGYDALNRLTDATGPSAGYWRYNQIGNLITNTDTAYTYPAAGSSRPHAVTAAGDNSYEYDANGNMVTRTLASDVYVLTYDPENRLVAVSKDGDPIASSTYDGDGNRVRAVVTDTGGVTATAYIGNYYEQTGEASRRRYYYLGGKRVAMRDGADELWFLLGDHLGSTSVAYRVSDAQTTTQRYYAWGAVRPGPGNELPTDYTYTGQRVVENVGLLYYGARWYDSWLGRFAQADTVVPEAGNPQALNRYTYVANRPLLLSDSTGHAYDASVGGGQLPLWEYHPEARYILTRYGYIDLNHFQAARTQTEQILNQLSEGSVVRVTTELKPGIDFQATYSVDAPPQGRDVQMALDMFEDFSRTFETWQGKTYLQRTSSYAVEDLPTDYLGFVSVVKGQTLEDIVFSLGYGVPVVDGPEHPWLGSPGEGYTGPKNRELTPRVKEGGTYHNVDWPKSLTVSYWAERPTPCQGGTAPWRRTSYGPYFP